MTPDPLVAAFDRLALREPGAPLVVSPRDRATVADVDALARQAGRLLGAAPAPPAPGEPVGLQAPNGPAFLAGLLALRRAGCAVLLLDRRTPPMERQRIAREVGARRALVAAAGWPAGGDDWHLDDVAGPPAAVELPPATAVIKTSSASTGAARGIAATSESLLADDCALTATMGIRSEDRLLATVPFSHSYGLSSLVVPALVRGTTLVLPGAGDPFAPLAAAAVAGATVFPTVPAYLGALARLADPPPLPPGLRLVLSAGAPLPAETSARFRERYGRPVHVFYGASECGGICYDREGSAAERGTVGAPVEGVRIEIEPLAGAGSRPGHDGGRVVVRSPAVALGYVPGDGQRLGGGRYATDDLGTWRDGELALTGRLNDLINVKGQKVNPREVERVLAALPAVEDVLVVPAPGAGELEQVVRAVVACRPGTLTPDEVLAWCRSRLAEHKVPRSVVLVDEVPRTDRGKVDRHALARLEPRRTWEPAPRERAAGS